MDEPPAEVIAALPLRRFQVRLADGEELVAVLHRGVVGRRGPPRLGPGSPVSVQRSPYESGVCRIVGVGHAAT
jgi:translation initiation factor IF-1